MEALNCPVGTNCGHTFCAPCILRWQREKWPDPCECPICRRQVGLCCCIILLGKADFMEMTETENGKGKRKHAMLQRSHAYLTSFNNNLQPGVFSSAIHASTKAGVFFVSTQNNCSSDLFVEDHSISVSVSIFISVKSVCPVCCIVQLICCLL